MYRIVAALALLRAWLIDPDDDPERGSETIEKVMWAVAVIAIVGIVVAAVTAYVKTQSALIN